MRFEPVNYLWLANTVKKLDTAQMCTPVQDHCPSCCSNHGGVYGNPCTTVYEFRPNAYIQLKHGVDGSNPKFKRTVCLRCEKMQARNQRWLRRKLSIFRLKPQRTGTAPCVICDG